MLLTITGDVSKEHVCLRENGFLRFLLSGNPGQTDSIQPKACRQTHIEISSIRSPDLVCLVIVETKHVEVSVALKWDALAAVRGKVEFTLEFAPMWLPLRALFAHWTT